MSESDFQHTMFMIRSYGETEVSQALPPDNKNGSDPETCLVESLEHLCVSLQFLPDSFELSLEENPC